MAGVIRYLKNELLNMLPSGYQDKTLKKLIF